MKLKPFLFVFSAAIALSSCVSKKQFTELEQKQKETQDLLNSATVKLNDCLSEEKAVKDRVVFMEKQIKDREDQIRELRNSNAALLENVGNLATLSAKEAQNLEKSLESIREKDLQIRNLRDAITKRDSVTLALVTSFKSSLGDLNDQDIEINVEKGVVYIAISDKLLFGSGSYQVTDRAKAVLAKVAKVVNDKPDIEIMVEGHTDNVPISRGEISDNWDLSVKRATSVVRILQQDFKVAPERMTAAGRSFYIPLAENDSPQNRAKNRRTRIVVLPKLDQFYQIVEDGMKQAEAMSKQK